jgi:hypothetical protein
MGAALALGFYSHQPQRVVSVASVYPISVSSERPQRMGFPESGVLKIKEKK